MIFYRTVPFWIADDALSGTALLELARLNDILDVRLETLKKAEYGGVYVEGDCRVENWDKVKAFCKVARTIMIDYKTMAEWAYEADGEADA